MKTQDVFDRVEDLSRQWNLSIDETRDTNTSILAFGMRGTDPVVLKVVRKPGDEWCSGKILSAFNGNGAVRAYEVTEGAVLLERIFPGTLALDLTLSGRDDEATAVLASVIQKMHANTFSIAVMAEDWAQAFDRYLASGNQTISANLVKEARRIYLDLCESQQHRRLLHGDLHHENVLFDARRGWLAVDPKGVVAETEFEIGPALLNPIRYPERFATGEVVRRRIDIFQHALRLDRARMLQWTFARAVLSAIWCWEDKDPLPNLHSAVKLASAIRELVVTSQHL